jgi:hypothetical protein
MERDTIIQLAREAGFDQTGLASFTEFTARIERFAALVAAAECERNDAYIKSLHESVSWQAERVIACLKALEKAVLAEREACAKVCDEVGERRLHSMHKHTSSECAAAIRARGQE